MAQFASIGNGNPVTVTNPTLQPGTAGAVAATKNDDYLVLLINMTDLCIEYGQKSYNKCNEKDVDYFPVPKTCRTCSSDCDGCHEAKLWQAVLVVNCNDSPFYLTLITKPDNNGNARGACWYIQPNCNYSGGSICLA